MTPLDDRSKGPPFRAWAHPWSAPLLVLAATLVAAFLVAISPLRQPGSNALSDLLWRATARVQHYDNVLAIDIDETSLRELQPLLGGWPFERDLHALVLNYLREAGATAVALDIVFPDPRRGDEALAAALRGPAPVVLAVAGSRRAFDLGAGTADRAAARRYPTAPQIAQDAPAFTWPALVLPHEALVGPAPGAPLLGVVTTPLDADGVLRRVPVLHRFDQGAWPTLPVALSQAVLGAAELGFDATQHHFLAGGRSWPVDAQGSLTAVQARNEDSVTTVPFARLALAALGKEADASMRDIIAGRAVIVGSSAFPGDAVMTPAGQVSGLHWLASTTGALLAGHVLQPAPWWMAGPLWLVALGPAALAWRRERLSGWLAAGVTAATLLAVLAVAAGARWWAGIEIDPLLPLVMVASGLIATLLVCQHAMAVAHRRAEFDRAVAEASNRAKSEFLAHVSHEIRTPMGAVLGVADLLAETDLNPLQQRHVAVFRRSGESLARMIDDLLDLSKIEAGRADLEREEFSLANLVRDQVALLRPRAQAKGIHLGLKLAPGLRSAVIGDRMRLTQVLVNLLANAIKFTARGGVSLEVGEDDTDPALVLFTVTDTGIGIDASKLDRIFEPFMQADTSVTRDYGGSGLGLTITRRIVEMMGGRINVRSTPGQGSEFSFVVPLPPARPASGAPAAGTPTTQPQGLNLGRELAILLADDNATNLYLVQAMLHDPAVLIDTVTNGHEALDRLAARRYDLVLMDLQMPVMDGLAATREWRRMEALRGLPRTPVIAITANAFDADRRRSIDAGCDDHLAKPLRKADLLRAVARWAPPSPSAEATVAQPDNALDVRHFDALAVLEGHGVIDVAAAVDRLGGNLRLYLQALTMMLPSLDEWRARYERARVSDDPAMAQRMAHDLKGVLGSIGAVRAAAAAAALEAAATGTDAATHGNALAAVEAELTPLRHLIRLAVEHVQTNPGAARPVTAPHEA